MSAAYFLPVAWPTVSERHDAATVVAPVSIRLGAPALAVAPVAAGQ